MKNDSTKKPSEPLPVSRGHQDPALPEGVIDMGAVMREALPKLREMEAGFTAHCKSIREQMRGVEEYCLEHEEQLLPVDWDRTFGRSWQENKLIPVYGECPICARNKKGSIVNDRWLKMGIPKKVAHATLDNFIVNDDDPDFRVARVKAREKVRRQLNKGSGFIILIGGVGTGKSHLSAAAIKKVGDGIFITLADLIKKLRQSYDMDDGEDFDRKYIETPILVLDELTPDVTGKDVTPLMYRILSHRYDDGKLTIINGNDELDIVKAIMGEKLVDRMSDDYVVANFIWKSARGQHESN